MKYTDLKIGDRIRINEKPRMWNSHLKGKEPMHLFYPWEGIVEEIVEWEKKSEKGVANISGYGFALDYITNYYIIDSTYEIY